MALLPKKYRLTRKKDFAMLYEKSRTANSDFLFLKYRVNGLNRTRIGFVVSKKVAKKAVERNKVKRQLREIMRDYLDKIESGMDIAVIAKPSILGKEFDEIKAVVEILLIKSRLVS